MHRAGVAAAMLLVAAACDGSTTAGPDDPIVDFAASSVGVLAGTIMRSNGTPAATLPLTAQIHGAVRLSATTDASGAFTMRLDNVIGQVLPTDTLLTVFVNARTQVGGVADSLVLREPVQVRLSRNLATPAVTTVQLRANF